MRDYERNTYGDAFADIYDDWYHGVSDIESTVAALGSLAGRGAVLELGVGTGRLALPLAALGREKGFSVSGIDASEAMLAKLRAHPDQSLVTTLLGDMVDDLPAGPFSLVFIAYNTLFNLTDPDRHLRCFEAVSAVLESGGHFVVEAFVPDPPPAGSDIAVKELSAHKVVLSVTVNEPASQRAEGQFVEFTEAGGVTLRPWAIRYATPAQLDRCAETAGFRLATRWETFDGTPFDDGSPRHVSVYRKR